MAITTTDAEPDSDDFEQTPSNPTPWEQYDVIPVWDVLDELDNGKQLHYDVRVE